MLPGSSRPPGVAAISAADVRETHDVLPDWCRAHGDPIIQADIKTTCSDFQVTEALGFELTGDGEHDFLWIEKTGANTSWVAQVLARHAGVDVRDVGFAGLKDRQALTRQWFSVRRPNRDGTDWTTMAADGVRILEETRHQRKLKRGAHRDNGFRIALRGQTVDREAIVERLNTIKKFGVPNYFGLQRFGYNGGNLTLARRLFAGKRMQRDQRSIAISAVRSFLFNAIVNARVIDESWDQALLGDTLNLDGSRSVFVPSEIDTEIEKRIADCDIHPTGAMWGVGELPGFGAPADVEQSIANQHSEYVKGLARVRAKMARRPLRATLKNLSWEVESSVLWLEFRLDRGCFATSVLRELLA